MGFSGMFPVGSGYPFRSSRRLKRLLRQALTRIGQTPREELTPLETWLEDHGRFLLEKADGLEKPRRLPKSGNVCRVLLLARQAAEEAGRLDAAGVLRAVRRLWPEEQEILQRELDFLPMALTAALFERLLPFIRRAEGEHRERRAARQFEKRLLQGRAKCVPPGLSVREKIVSRLAEDEGGLRLLDALLRPAGETAGALAEKAHLETARQGQAAGDVIQSLHSLDKISWPALTERLSPVARVLRQDKTYRQMDRESRGYYVACCCRIARRLHVGETAAARAALALCQGESGEKAEVGYYLIERPDCIAAYLLKRKAPRTPRPERKYACCLGFSAVCTLLLCVLFRVPWFLWPLVLLCASEPVRLMLHPLLLRGRLPRMLPRLRPAAIDPTLRVLIVVPTLLTSRKQALRMARRLSVLRAAAPQRRFEFMLLGDFADAARDTLPGDGEITAAAAAAVEALNQKHGGGFWYLHRARTQSRDGFGGRERKRGALEMLNRLIAGENCPDSLAYSSADPASLAGRFAYVITLDADTVLPPGAAMGLLGTMEHPLQKGRIRVIQPRMETAADQVRTRVQQYLGGRGGVDPYHLARQELYQDVFGKGSYVGKGIYAPVPFLRATEGRIPPGRILSHDLLEGEMAGSALADDIVLYDGHPAALAGWLKRLHRWTRGDWQLLPFLFDRSLSRLSRMKMWDNLRRSLLPVGQVLLLLLSALLGRPILFLLALPWPFRGMGLRLMLLPSYAVTLADAAFRALYRQFVSGKRLLSWVTAAQQEGSGGLPLPCALAHAGLGAGMTALAMLFFPPGVIVGVLWLLPPLLIRFLDGPCDQEPGLGERDIASLRDLARRTWRFFDMNVGAATHFLPPDNVQLDPDKGPALRTSPTNIGLYLLSVCAARELGIVTTAHMMRRTADTLNTLERLPRWHGHFYNWYDLNTLSPLRPLFVSTVDSGNLAGCLLCCAQLCRERMAEADETYASVPARLDALVDACDFAPLYDPEADLFAIGLDAESGKRTPACYDLLASEARLASYIALMQGQIPLRHWRRLGRNVTRAGGGAALLSWGGTMFEYLLPTLLLPLEKGTLLGEGCLSAVRAQMAEAGRRPFGISECGYYAFDPDLNYQYRAFGLPALALSGETAGQVIAPYASLLALPFFPRAAARNAREMKGLGWLDEQGFFEAADYAPQRVEKGPRLIYSHMAHHQGMILCAVCNALTGFTLVRAFMTPARAQAYHYLLWEYPPARPRRRPALPPPRSDAPGPFVPSPRPARPGLPPEACLLYGGGTTWLMAGNGQGFLKKGDLFLTRFDPEAGAQTGFQLYLRDPVSGNYFRPMAEETPVFGCGSAAFSGSRLGVQWNIRCCVAPLTGAAYCRLEMENIGKKELEVEAVSFLEIALSTYRADAAHPNFRDLSVRIEPWEKHGLLSRRLPREPGENCPPVRHFVTGDVAALRRQGDRRLFLGRLGTYAAPAQLAQPFSECEMRTGDVTAPCMSLFVRVRIPAGARRSLVFVTVCGGDSPVVEPFDAALALAETRERMTLRFLRVEGRALSRYRIMLGALLFSGQPHQAALPPAPIDCLWGRGISGDLPILTVSVISTEDAALIRHALRCHAWARAMGVSFDLVLLLPEESQYLRPLRDAAASLIEAHADRALTGEKGGVHLIAVHPEERERIESRAGLRLHGGESLHRQLARLHFTPPEAPPARMEDALPVLPPPLRLYNGFGGFGEDGAYSVVSPAPVPWHNLLAGPHFCTVVCETALLQSFLENSHFEPVTRPGPDPFRALPSESLFLRRGDSLYSLIGCTARHEPGVTTYSRRCGDVYAECAVFSHGEWPLGVRLLTLRSEKAAALRIQHVTRFHTGRGDARCEGKDGFVFARAGDAPYVAFAALAGSESRVMAPAALTGLQEAFPWPGLRPAAPETPGSVGILTQEVTLRPHEAQTLLIVLGAGKTEADARHFFAMLLHQGGKEALRQVRADWDRRLSRTVLYGLDAPTGWLFNRWLPYQTIAARLMARTGPYQPGGAYGFRDQLQDLLPLLYIDPAAARAHILLSAAHQYEAGDVQHWWHAPQKGVRTRISDDKLFLPYLAALYVDVTGDETILAEPVPYLVSPPLSEGENDRYEEPGQTADRESLLRHCLRAVDSVTLGRHDLPLMLGGDWNDGMNRVGGRAGESVWLGFFLILVLKRFSPLCPPEEKQRLTALRRKLQDGAEQAWAEQWYLRAFRDTGEAVGGPDTDPPRIDLISQAFAVLAGAPRDHAREALRQAVNRLYDREHGIVKLLWPPFTPEENAGYIGAYLPGVRENGGQYTHAVPWLILALCRLGEYPLAWEIFRAVLPPNHGDTQSKTAVYQVEPYVLAGDVYAGENTGRGGWTWYTGSAAWMWYALLTGLLGFEKHGSRARLVPHPPGEPEEYTLLYRFGSATYHFTAAPDAPFPTLDGEKLRDGWADLRDDGKTHEARYPMR